MKVIFSCAVVLLMTITLYGGQLMHLHTTTGDVYYNLGHVDSITFFEDSITDVRDGQRYAIVLIGNQIWMAENLNVGVYKASVDTGSSHSDVSDNGIIEKYAYNNDTTNFATYGGLYDWDEAMGYSTAEGVQGICPDGWHIPTDAEWKTLEMYLGMSKSEADQTGYRGTDQGTKLQEGGSSGFQALLSGCRSPNGTFSSMGSHAYLWSSSQYSALYAWYRYMYSGYGKVYRTNVQKTYGCCVRCVKD